jgi:ribonuclease HII
MDQFDNKIIAGVDEAGRGPLAGRVYAAAVVLNKTYKYDGLNDSKKLTHNKREILFKEIINNCSSYGIGFATVEEIEKINILQASFLAMKRALECLKVKFDYILVDGNIFPFKSPLSGEAIIKGDEKIHSIMAASILAKVARDKYMLEMDKEFPEYNFHKHKGYPTKLHRELIKQFGPSSIHRKTFRGVKEYLK